MFDVQRFVESVFHDFVYIPELGKKKINISKYVVIFSMNHIHFTIFTVYLSREILIVFFVRFFLCVCVVVVFSPTFHFDYDNKQSTQRRDKPTTT